MPKCPNTEKCPLFNDSLLKRQETADAYKAIYCETDYSYKECMRYLIAEKYGKCADFIMPNSSFSFEDIENRMRNEGLI